MSPPNPSLLDVLQVSWQTKVVGSAAVSLGSLVAATVRRQSSSWTCLAFHFRSGLVHLRSTSHRNRQCLFFFLRRIWFTARFTAPSSTSKQAADEDDEDHRCN
ncbi:hypothetical protein PIB30_004021 [Stylosanthes scabra]|uniref:Secreted protein n=1 Tax=Stylosanthes scabra TaxID=79078 RepID=A0ABU6X5C2_9FABA|nr:hypothetical protein [Stylosanthes scabra]